MKRYDVFVNTSSGDFLVSVRAYHRRPAIAASLDQVPGVVNTVEITKPSVNACAGKTVGAGEAAVEILGVATTYT